MVRVFCIFFLFKVVVLVLVVAHRDRDSTYRSKRIGLGEVLVVLLLGVNMPVAAGLGGTSASDGSYATDSTVVVILQHLLD